MEMHSVIQIYKKVCECKSEICKSFPEIYNNANEGSPPRGFYSKSNGEVKVLVVGKNPGHALEKEALIYKNINGVELVKAHWEFAEEIFYRKYLVSSKDQRSTTFHSNLMSYMSEILDLSFEEIFEKIAYTNLVKCSTKNERLKLKKLVIDECFNNHLSREINFFKPVLIFALGREVERYLVAIKKSRNYEFTVAYIKHPSYHYKKENKAEKINDLKILYKKVCAM